MNLEEQLDRARAGDGAAFERLLLFFQPQLYHLAYQQLGNRDDAQDACQEAALDAWRSIGRFQGGPDDLRRWLLRIVANASLDRLRHDARRPQVPLEVRRGGQTVPLPLPHPGQSPEDYALGGDLQSLLEACLTRLTHEHRTLIVLDRLGMSYAEMAEITDAGIGTVKSRLSRARAHMRELLTSESAWSAEPPPGPRRSYDEAQDPIPERRTTPNAPRRQDGSRDSMPS